MLSSTMRNGLRRAVAVLFWLLLWQGAAMLANRSLLVHIPTPADTLCALWRMAGTGSFYLTVGASLLRIVVGFLAALVLGTGCAVLSARSELFSALSAPLFQLLRAIPVASLTIVVFLWVDRTAIPSCIAFVTVFPIVWSNVEGALRSASRELGEMAQVFGMSRRRILQEITLPGIRPAFSAAVVTGLGFAWKSGVAAEVICRTPGSIGDLLWQSKSAVDYDEVFALTLVIVALSMLTQHLAGPLLGTRRRAA
jgi:NitT/TauT family transport system permease protein